ncbi:MAG: methyltetrahydrofolate cobalamin methyltransferase [Dehalobacterium sp.]
MLIVGESINTSRKAINEIVENRDAESIKRIAREQVEAGADYLDVNCGTQAFDEVDTMEWLVNNIQEAVQVPLCIDSPEANVLEAGLKLVKYGQPLVNSITAEKETFKAILPVVLKYNPKIVALCMNDEGIPKTAEERFKVAEILVRDLTDGGVSEEDIYLDPLIQPISANDKAGLEVLKTLRLISEKYPKVHKICGLSNISFGSPNRKMLNQLFTVLTMDNGMDSYILNPLDKTMIGFIHATKALIGQDPSCLGYIAAHRRGLYEG